MVQPIPGKVVDQLLAAICDLMPIGGASCYFVDEQGRPFGHRLTGLSREQLYEYRREFCERDPFSPVLHEPSGKDIIALEDVASQRNAAGYLEGFLHRYGYCDEVEMFFRRSDGRIAMGVGMIRDERCGRFRANELELIAKVKPFLHLALAVFLNTNAEGVQWRTSSFASQLTTREVEVVEHLLSGASNREIANLCNVTVATVKAHFFNIFDKTGVTSRTELVARILTQ